MSSTVEERLRDYATLLDEVVGARAPVGEARPSAKKHAAPTALAGVRTFVVAVAIACLVAAGAAAVVATRHSHSPAGSPTTLAPAPSTSVAVSSSVPETTTTPTTSAAPTTLAGVPLQSVDWAAVTYPAEARCGHSFNPSVVVLQVAYATPATGATRAVVEARCNAGAGTPSSEVYVYDRADSARSPHLAQTLITMTDNWQTRPLRVAGDTISLPAYGFTTSSVPRCCPDVQTTLVWQWNGSDYALTSAVPPHLQFPPP